MSETTQAAAQSVLHSEGVNRSVRRLRLIGAVIALCLAMLLIAAAAAMGLRAFVPIEGTMTAALIAAAVAVAALGGGAAALEGYGRRARKAESMEAAVGAYSTGCIVAWLGNLTAGAVTICVIVLNGVGSGLWIPQLLVLALNVLGLALAMPKMKHLRELHYRPTLPVSRV
ncbi:MAG: hypothetical protein ACYS5V_00280 [Planctomycetota bacterium]|jgi:hypothetical protein